ncbi:SPW repeat protein [Streptomyces sp. B1I3]|uniref:SPW repeat domain-containing protein n=1 Tax=Streptomyces sp. B1I3 TaxID=3042264 RepID=UPI00277D2AC9|nr:SPW repeat protein [Streptomyces sp. B1I3]MDQ0791756.1 putative MFS family arabinose efflux permease [Streptomyces sp. B1I3]
MASGAVSTPPDSAGQHVLLHGWREQIISFLMFLVGIALCVAPWVGGDTLDAAKDIHRSEVGIAILVLLVAISRLSGHTGKWSDWTMLLAGAWLVASPWLLALQNTEVFDGAHVFDVAAGAVLLALAASSMFLRAVLHRAERRTRR